MKTFLPLIFVLALSAQAFAEDTPDTSDNFNVRVGPISLLVGVVNIGLDIAVNDSWTVGPEFSYLHRTLSSSAGFTTDYDVTAFAAGGRAIWYMNGVFTDGMYLTPKVDWAKAKVSSTDSLGTVEGEASVFIASGLVGYAWFWDGFNIHLGAGFSLPIGEYKVKIKDSTGAEESVAVSTTGNLALEFDLGWTF